MLNRQQAQELVDKYISTETIKFHVKEVAILMKAVAKELGKNEEEWEIIGLLHDLDYDKEKEHPELQTVTLEKWIKEVDPNFPEEDMHAIKAHNQEYSKVLREKPMDFALAACDNLSGMIFSTALIYPERKISTLKPENVLKKMKNPSFAARVNRQSIIDIEKTGIKLERFIEMGIKALGDVEEELGL